MNAKQIEPVELDGVRGFLEGFEDDEMQEGVDELLKDVDAAQQQLQAYSTVVALLREVEGLAELGDVNENTEAYGWGAWLKSTRLALNIVDGIELTRADKS